jgi:hypothetical protein
MKILVRAWLCTAALAGPAAAAAQDAAPQSEQSTITVTGEKPSKQSIRDFVRDLAPVAPSLKLSRFEHNVCPAAFGLPPNEAAMVAKRMRLVAKGAGIAVGGDACTPNVVVIVTSDKKGLLEQLAKQRPEYFGDLGHGAIKKLEQQPGPAAAWQIAGLQVDADGREIQWDPQTGLPTNRTITPPSRITDAAAPTFDAAVVVVERASLDGLTTTQLADYAAMRAYAGADPARLGSSNVPTILRALDAPMGTAVPITLTSWDFGFLHGLYSGRRDLRSASQRSAISDTMSKDLHARKDK